MIFFSFLYGSKLGSISSAGSIQLALYVVSLSIQPSIFWAQVQHFLNSSLDSLDRFIRFFLKFYLMIGITERAKVTILDLQ